MRFVSAFAGIGGMDLGFEQAGWKCVGQVELDKHARSVLERHWPEVPKHDDITTAIEWADRIGLVGGVDVVAGGFPCQPFSVAGKRLGRDDLRGNLFWNALEFTTHIGAPILILENVPGLLTADKGIVFGEIVSDLAEAGFHHIEWRVLDSQNFGVPQRRRRVFILACRDPSIFGGREVLTEREGMRWHPPQGWQAGTDTAGTTAGSPGSSGWWAGGEGVAATLLTNAQGGLRTTAIDGGTFVVEPEARFYGMTQFAGYSEGVTTLTATDYKRPEQNIVVREVEEGAVR